MASQSRVHEEHRHASSVSPVFVNPVLPEASPIHPHRDTRKFNFVVSVSFTKSWAAHMPTVEVGRWRRPRYGSDRFHDQPSSDVMRGLFSQPVNSCLVYRLVFPSSSTHHSHHDLHRQCFRTDGSLTLLQRAKLQMYLSCLFQILRQPVNLFKSH